jgi:hypothetical protein
MTILLAGTKEFVHIEQVSALFTFCLGKVLLHIELPRDIAEENIVHK